MKKENPIPPYIDMSFNRDLCATVFDEDQCDFLEQSMQAHQRKPRKSRMVTVPIEVFMQNGSSEEEQQAMFPNNILQDVSLEGEQDALASATNLHRNLRMRCFNIGQGMTACMI